jgi:hypothetical protein
LNRKEHLIAFCKVTKASRIPLVRIALEQLETRTLLASIQFADEANGDYTLISVTDGQYNVEWLDIAFNDLPPETIFCSEFNPNACEDSSPGTETILQNIFSSVDSFSGPDFPFGGMSLSAYFSEQGFTADNITKPQDFRTPVSVEGDATHAEGISLWTVFYPVDPDRGWAFWAGGGTYNVYGKDPFRDPLGDGQPGDDPRAWTIHYAVITPVPEPTQPISLSDTVLDVFPGPMHSEPELIVSDGEFVYFTAETEWQGPRQLFQTDGTIEGTVQLPEGTTLPQPVEYGLSTDYVLEGDMGDACYWTQHTSYLDTAGRNFQFVGDPAEAGETELPCDQPVGSHGLYVFGVLDQSVIVSVSPRGFNWGDAYLANGDFDQWQHLTSGIVIGETGLVEFNGRLIWALESGMATFNGDYLTGGNAFSTADLMLTYVLDGGTILRRDNETPDPTPELFFDFSAHEFEFPTEFRGIASVFEDRVLESGEETTLWAPLVYHDAVVINAWDPVHEALQYLITADGTVVPYAGDPAPPEYFIWQLLSRPTWPEDPLVPLMAAGGYEFFDRGNVTYAVRDGEEFATRLAADGIRHAVADCFIFPEYDSIDTGRELTVRRFVAGDVNLDGLFDSKDLVALMALGEYEDDLVGNSHHLSGDFNGDGEFDSADLVEALALGWYS